MIHVTQRLCEGCGICVEACPPGAITLVDSKARVDSILCDGCGSLDETYDRVCIDLCPNNVLSWVIDPMPERPTEASSLVIVDPRIVNPRVKVIPAPTRAPMAWY
jgi:Fe-S-cluster-containing hydrogenase component 2